MSGNGDPLARFSAPEKILGGRNGSPKFADHRKPVELPNDARLMSDFAGEVGEVAREQGLFRRDRLTVCVDGGEDGARVIGEQEFRTLIERKGVCFRTLPPRKKEDAEVKILATMTTDQARAVLASPHFLEKLPPLEQVNDVPAPVQRADGSIRLFPAGYDESTGTFTLNKAKYPEFSFDEARGVIDELWREFCFADEGRSKAVAISAMLTVFARGLMPAAALRPGFIYLGNSPGSGKTTAADCAVVPVFGKAYRLALPRKEEEMEKTLLTAVMESAWNPPVLYFDNARGFIASGSLEAFLTSVHWRGRILSVSKTFAGRNNMTVFVTGNGCTVSPDLRRRSLFVELFNPEARAEAREFSKPLNERVLIERRFDILGALWALVKAWDKGGRPGASQVLNGCVEWSHTIGAIVEYAGFGCPTEAPDLSSGGDEDLASMVALVKLIPTVTTGALNFDDLVKLAAENGLFERLLENETSLDRSTRSSFGKLLKGFDGQTIGPDGHRFIIEGKGHGRRFRVEKRKERES